MKKNVFLAALLAIALQQVVAQNVGIGTNTPSQKLDVNGNVNISGTIMANGTAGTSGQVLTSTGSGLAWQTAGSQMGYKKCLVFNSPGTGIWSVPAGVTEVMVELWGGGSGGTINIGGTSGGYARTVQSVSSGFSFNYSIGTGSAGGVTSTFLAGATTVQFNGASITAYGGSGSSDGTKGSPLGGFAGNNLTNAFTMYGNRGEANTHIYGMKNNTTYVETISYGRGGEPVGMFNPYPTTGDVIRNENGILVYKVAAGNTVIPSGGGAAGAGQGYKGGDGMVIFWFN